MFQDLAKIEEDMSSQSQELLTSATTISQLTSDNEQLKQTAADLQGTFINVVNYTTGMVNKNEQPLQTNIGAVQDCTCSTCSTR